MAAENGYNGYYPAEVVLSEVIYKKLGLYLEANTLRAFVLDNWATISYLAHGIKSYPIEETATGASTSHDQPR